MQHAVPVRYSRFATRLLVWLAVAAISPILLSAAVTAQEKTAEALLDEAADLLNAREEGVRHKGAEILLELNSVDSVAVMLDFMNRENPHTRDIVWDALIKIRDPYARKRVELELKRNKSNAEVRQWCAEALGIYGDAAFGESLKKALGDKFEPVQRAAARSLGKIAYEPAARALLKASRDKDHYLRANAIEALARIDPEKYLKNVEKGLEDKSPEVRTAVLGITPSVYPDQAEAWAAAALDDEDWRPRMQAVDNLAGIRTKASVDMLISAIGDGRPVVSRRAVVSLQKMTRQKWTLTQQWQLWWQENREIFNFPRGKHRFQATRDERYATYNKIQVVSDRVAFLIDKSQGMSSRLKNSKTKDERAHEELDATLGRLSGDFVFNVYTYAKDLQAFQRKPLTLNSKSHKAALEFVATKPNVGNKDIWAALETLVESEDFDTIFLQSSGEPEIGLYVHWNRVVDHLADLNRFHKVVVHSVAYSDSDWYRTQLRKIAESTGGEFAFEE